MTKKSGVLISQLRKKWIALGLCRPRGGGLRPGGRTCGNCKRKHADRRKRNRGDTRPVPVSMPRDLHAKIEADANERGETIEQWLVAEAAAAFENENNE